MLKTFFFFIVTNLAVVILASFVLSILGVTSYITETGLQLGPLFIFAMVIGFAGSFISLLMSKWMAKSIYGIHIIETPTTENQRWLKSTVERLSTTMNIKVPEVGIYDKRELNAFATGASKNSALVAFSTGLLDRMTREEAEGVIAHELAHVKNGDMMTMTLIQGVLNTFVIFFARIASYLVTTAMRSDDEEESPVGGIAYFLVTIVFEILFGIIATIISCWFSRIREFKADEESAKNVGKHKMIAALERLNGNRELEVDAEPQMASFKISSHRSVLGLFTTHPPLEARIEKLRQLNI